MSHRIDYVSEHIKDGIQYASISGGTDLNGCFALGCPLLPVYKEVCRVRVRVRVRIRVRVRLGKCSSTASIRLMYQVVFRNCNVEASGSMWLCMERMESLL
jgi:hypothetical protein